MKGRNVEGRFQINPRGPFSLAAGLRFLESFTPAAYKGGAKGHLHFAFSVEGAWKTVGVCVRQSAKLVVGSFVGDAEAEIVRRQVARILSLDIDGRRWPEVGARDPAVAVLQSRFPGLRPVLFCSPYEAAAWTLIGHRVRMTQASRIKQDMAHELGESIEIHGQHLHAFPSPERLARLQEWRSMPSIKVDRLRNLGEAARAGHLDAESLRSMSNPTEHLKELHGVGDFSAELILVRGAGEPDYWPRYESRLHRAMAVSYGYAEVPSVDDLAAIAEKWRPFRSWASLLFRASATQESK